MKNGDFVYWTCFTDIFCGTIIDADYRENMCLLDDGSIPSRGCMFKTFKDAKKQIQNNFFFKLRCKDTFFLRIYK